MIKKKNYKFSFYRISTSRVQCEEHEEYLSSFDYNF